MKTKFKKYFFKQENGIAIILTLGILSVIFLLVLAYVNLAIIDRKATDNYNALQQARMSAQSAYQRAIALVSSELEGGTSGNALDIYTYNVGKDHDGLEELLETVVEGVSYQLKDDYNVDSGPHWQYIPEDHGADTPIITRFAYCVIADQGRIDPSAAAYATTGRPGRDIGELYLNALDNTWFGNNEANLKLTEPSRWNSFDEIFTALTIADGSTTADSFRTYFVLKNEPDAEAFWSDNGDLQRETSELYHRFNLTRPATGTVDADWDEITVDSILSQPLLYNESTDSSKIFSILWLKNWDFDGGFSNADSCSRQIAANLIDYCDADIKATTDSEDAPGYVGLEKCPYINEVRLQVTGEVDTEVDDIDSTKYNYTCTVTIDGVDVEVINMYDVDFKSSAKEMTAEINVIGRYRWKPWNEDGTDTEVNFDTSFNPINNISVDSEAYSNWTSTSETISTAADTLYGTSNGNLSKSINCFQIKKLTVKLINSASADFYDFSYIVDTEYGDDSEIISSDGTSNTLYLAYQINDPRQNLLHADWEDIGVDGGNTGDSPFVGIDNIGTLDSPYTNNNITPAGGGEADTETGASEPWDISTAYVRNAPMESPWELGLIHRGQKWQTINLKKYNSSEGMKGGGTEYIDGDANILDQIKMTSDNTTYGKININTELKDVLKVLFEKIRVGTDVDSPESATTGFELDSIRAGYLADSTLAGSAAAPFYTRSQILRGSNGVSILYDNFLEMFQDNDAKQEEIIGKFINLTKALPSDTYTVIVVAQAIKDVGGGHTIKKMVNGAETTIPNVQTGTYDQYADEILGTQKILAIGQWNQDTKKFRIIRFQYIDE